MLRVRGCSGLRVHEVWGLRAYGGLEGVGRPKRGVYCGFKGLVVQEFLLCSSRVWGFFGGTSGLGLIFYQGLALNPKSSTLMFTSS